MQTPPREWRSWSDHPLAVWPGVILAVIGIILGLREMLSPPTAVPVPVEMTRIVTMPVEVTHLATVEVTREDESGIGVNPNLNPTATPSDKDTPIIPNCGGTPILLNRTVSGPIKYVLGKGQKHDHYFVLSAGQNIKFKISNISNISNITYSLYKFYGETCEIDEDGCDDRSYGYELLFHDL